MTAQEAYAEDVRRRPNYDDGTPRPTWEQLDELGPNVAGVVRLSWEWNPTPRPWKGTVTVPKL